MDEATAERLRGINRRFYDRQAEAFSSRRQGAWPGWERVLARLRERSPGGDLAVLDLGCGNGRFCRFLDERLDRRFDYTGVDASAALLRLAEAAAGLGGDGDRRWLELDLLRGAGLEALRGRRFDLVVAFGVLHHVPGREARRRLIEAAAARVRPGGLLALSFWQFGERRRFRRRIVPWEEHERSGGEPVDRDRLEPGDHLLAWGDGGPRRAGGGPLRYCHWTTPAEAEELVSGVSGEPSEWFRADGEGGDLNLYCLLRPAAR